MAIRLFQNYNRVKHNVFNIVVSAIYVYVYVL